MEESWQPIFKLAKFLLSTIPDIEDTIVAIASPPGSGVRGIVRLSGPKTLSCLARSFVVDPDASDNGAADQFDALKSASVLQGNLKLVEAEANDDGEATLLPGKLMVWPDERSFTRQPSAEFHTIGSTPALQMAVKSLCREGARMAEPGEFTMRAFLSGRIDLTQAEAVLAVIDSQNRNQLDVALGQLAGGLAGELDGIRNQLLGALAELEAGLDFVEEDIEFISNEEMVGKLVAGQESLSQMLQKIDSRDRTQAQFRVGLFGLPNAGKSSLFNAMTGADQAIVTDLAGTTTDLVTATCRFESVSYKLVDTAGAETDQPADSISFQAQQHRQAETDRSDLSILCISVNEIPDPVAAIKDLDILPDWHRQQLATEDSGWIVVFTQCDLLDPEVLADCEKLLVQQPDRQTEIVLTSSVQQLGMDRLSKLIARAVVEFQTAEASVVTATVLRTSECLRASLAAIESATEAATLQLGDEIVASEVRAGLDSLGQIVGKVYTDDILDVVFGQFCIGK